jgi:hypothetical protein
MSVALCDRWLPIDFRYALFATEVMRRCKMLRRARSGHVRATSAASLPCRLSPSTIRVGGVLLACEQRRLAAIVTADMVGYSHAAYEQIYYSSLMPRTYLCARLLETLD